MGKQPLAGQETTADSDQTWLERIARADPTFKNAMKLEITLSDITANMMQRERKKYYKDMAALLHT